MVILGIDPGLATMGYGVIQKEGQKLVPLAYGALTTKAGVALPHRLRSLVLGIEHLLDTYKPDEVAFEELFFSKNVTTGISVAHARGAAMAAVVRKCECLYEYTPMQVKLAVCGWGKADKRQVQMMVRTLLHLKEDPKPDDAADALAIAICHAHTGGMGSLYQIK